MANLLLPLFIIIILFQLIHNFWFDHSQRFDSGLTRSWLHVCKVIHWTWLLSRETEVGKAAHKDILEVDVELGSKENVPTNSNYQNLKFITFSLVTNILIQNWAKCKFNWNLTKIYY